jgi:hypothetical protein
MPSNKSGGDAGSAEGAGRQGPEPHSIPLHSVIEAMSEGVIIVSAKGHLRDINEAARTMLTETLGLALNLPLDSEHPGNLPDDWSRLDEHGGIVGE